MTEKEIIQVSEANLAKKFIKFQTDNDEEVEIEAIYEDSMPNGSTVGTVVGLHGAPGSHNDFKYIRDKLDQMNIRFIGINYPGFGNTLEYEGQLHSNSERNSYVEGVLNELGIEGRIVYMGHSRGCENALQMAVRRNAHGLILINPTGLRHHKGLRPFYRLTALNSLYNVLPKKAGNALMYRIYQTIGFRVKTGEVAINSLRSALTMSLKETIESIEKSNELNIQKLIVFGGSDHLVEEEIVFEKLEKHDGLKHFEFIKNLSEEEKDEIVEEFGENRRGASVFVKKDNHFQNKSQADLIAKCCSSMFT